MNLRTLATALSAALALLATTATAGAQTSAPTAVHPGPIAPDGQAVGPYERLETGKPVQIAYSGSCYRGEVLALSVSGPVHVHYAGWENSWDEWVDRARLRTGGSAMPLMPSPSLPPAAPPGPPVEPATALAPGQRLRTEWHGAWYPTEVVALVPGGAVRVHYVGYAASWDEDVPRARLRLEKS